MAAQASVHADAAAAGLSAAWLYGLVPRPPAQPRLLVPHHQRVRRPAGVLRRSRHVAESDRTMVDGILALTPTFWIIATSAQREYNTLLSYAIDLGQRDLIDTGDVADRLASMPRVASRATLARCCGGSGRTEAIRRSSCASGND